MIASNGTLFLSRGNNLLIYLLSSSLESINAPPNNGLSSEFLFLIVRHRQKFVVAMDLSNIPKRNLWKRTNNNPRQDRTLENTRSIHHRNSFYPK